MHLIQHICRTNKHISRLTYGRAPAKGSNPVVTRNRRIRIINYHKATTVAILATINPLSILSGLSLV